MNLRRGNYPQAGLWEAPRPSPRIIRGNCALCLKMPLLEFYKERKVGPQGCAAVAVKLLARRK